MVANGNNKRMWEWQSRECTGIARDMKNDSVSESGMVQFHASHIAFIYCYSVKYNSQAGLKAPNLPD